jgi:hypothetical protein
MEKSECKSSPPKDAPSAVNLAEVPGSVKDSEFILIDDDLTLALDAIVRTKIFGQSRDQVAQHIIRQYLWQNDRSLHDIGACPSAIRCKHGD